MTFQFERVNPSEVTFFTSLLDPVTIHQQSAIGDVWVTETKRTGYSFTWNTWADGTQEAYYESPDGKRYDCRWSERKGKWIPLKRLPKLE